MKNFVSAILAAGRLLSIKISLISLMAAFSGCELFEEPNPYGDNKGRVTFWTSLSDGARSIDISVKGSPIGSLTQYYNNGGPDCNDISTGTVKYVGEPGTYTYRATTTTGMTWEGSFTITEGECQTIELQGAANTLPPSYNKQGTITVRSRNISISVYDYAKIDGDILTLLFNGQTLVSNLEITATKKTFTLSNLPVGDNWIGVIAVSEGSDPPCTPHIDISDGYRTQSFEIRAKKNQPGGYTIKVQL